MSFPHRGGEKKYTYVYFTSHGLYYPTTIENFRNSVCALNYYEWKNISEDHRIKNKSAKAIYVRDIYKNWCIHGINGTCDSMDKLCELIKKLTNGEHVITVGSSAGGYMAIAVGTAIGADAIYALAPQVSITEYNKYHRVKYLEYYLKDENISSWLNLESRIEKYQGDLFYLFPANCEEDVAQYEVISGINNPCLHVLAVKYSSHGNPIYSVSLIKTLADPIEINRKFFMKMNGKTVTRFGYLTEKCGLFTSVVVIIGSKIKKIIKRLISLV